MFLKNMRIAYLLDFYQDALDGHTLSAMRAYYNDDLSLSEIAGDFGISRQGIRHLIKKGEEQLEFFESRFGLVKRHEELSHAAQSLASIRDMLAENPEYENETEELTNIIATLLKGNQDVPESY